LKQQLYVYMRHPASGSDKVAEVSISKMHKGFDCYNRPSLKTNDSIFFSDYYQGGRLSYPGPTCKYFF